MSGRGQKDSTSSASDSRKAKLLAENAAQFGEYVVQALAVADELGISTKPLKSFWLSPAQRDLLLVLPGISESLKVKLKKQNPSLTVAEVVNLAAALAEASTQGDPARQMAVLLVAKHLTEQFQDEVVDAVRVSRNTKKPKSTASSKAIFQFKITLLGSKPPIWRRIQVQDCTLDKLHEHIQTAMGWTNSHLHQFEINDQRYGDPELLDDGLDDFDCEDSTKTKISKILPKSGKQLQFKYKYDFGDGWDHEVLFEGSPKKEPGSKYPLCLEGERACPPEDVGGIFGFYEFLKVIRNPKHEEHEVMLEWVGGGFDPEEFDAKQTTAAMKKGLPDWREM